jgi:hypothetical protein
MGQSGCVTERGLDVRMSGWEMRFGLMALARHEREGPRWTKREGAPCRRCLEGSSLREMGYGGMFWDVGAC